MAGGGLVQLLTTFGSREDALRVAREAVEARVAACVQVVGPVTSLYRWEGRLEEAEEFLCLLKAPAEGLDRLVAFVRALHPYNTPELTAVASAFVEERYLAWARSETLSPPSPGPA
ncbi:MAG TPA: divalent-cation tolerance protein CutA [Actinomycetota bacterium]|nr:divalent-cation tolerance protein CutA [Actinomycetota bacterium]